MTDKSIRTNDIFFPPMFKLSNSLISEAVPDSTSPQEVLTIKECIQISEICY